MDALLIALGSVLFVGSAIFMAWGLYNFNAAKRTVEKFRCVRCAKEQPHYCSMCYGDAVQKTQGRGQWLTWGSH